MTMIGGSSHPDSMISIIKGTKSFLLRLVVVTLEATMRIERTFLTFREIELIF